MFGQLGDCTVERSGLSKPLRVHFQLGHRVQGLVGLQEVTKTDPVDLCLDPLGDVFAFFRGEANREVDLESLVGIVEHAVLHNVVPLLFPVALDGSAHGRAIELRERHRVGGVVAQEVHPGRDLGRKQDNGLEVKDHVFVLDVHCLPIGVGL
ncbi:MAG: hypothetical protein JW384_00516 [Nitrosomonadaceae bacterium]|nr:hypothetical protein [Nitrosomonadaceae bacterium]